MELLPLSVYKKNDMLYMTLTDNGVGMDEEALINVFRPFFSKGKPSGTGLGMSIVQRIVEAHDGKVSVESKVGRGTTVFISFPV